MSSDSESVKGPTIIALCGGTGAGKTTVVNRLSEALGKNNCCVIAQDAYYNDFSALSVDERANLNFDHPDSLELSLLAEHLRQLKAGYAVEVPNYDFATHTRTDETTRVESHDYIITEGILVLSHPDICEIADVTIFLETPADLRLARRVQRDIAERGRDWNGVLAQYLRTVRPMHEQFVAPCEETADVVVHCGDYVREDVWRICRDNLAKFAESADLDDLAACLEDSMEKDECL
jgi:uridine kinase